MHVGDAMPARGSYDALVVFGIGGSGLGARAVLKALGSKGAEVRVVDNIDPATIRAGLEGLNPERTIINLVTLPEEMPVRETLELRDQVDNLLQIPKGYLLINGVWPDLMNERDLTAMRTFREEAAAHGDPVVDGAMACLRSLIRRRRFQAKYLEQLRHEVVMPHIEVPFVFTNDFGFDAIHTLSDHIIRESERSGAYPARPVKR